MNVHLLVCELCELCVCHTYSLDTLARFDVRR